MSVNFLFLFFSFFSFFVIEVSRQNIATGGHGTLNIVNISFFSHFVHHFMLPLCPLFLYRYNMFTIFNKGVSFEGYAISSDEAFVVFNVFVCLI